MLFGTFASTVWKPSCAKLRECILVGYESALNRHILPQWSGKDLDSITVADIESWLDSFDKPGAARKAWAVFRAILRLAFRRGMTDNDVTRREIRLPRLRHYEPRVLSAQEVRKLLKGFYGHPLEAWLLVSVCAGLRRCESVGIEWSDLDLRRGTVTVKRSVQWVAGHETVTDPSVFQFACLLYVVPCTFATHPRPTVLEGFTPALNSQTVKLPTFTVLRNEDRSTKIKPSLTVMVFEAP